MKIIIAGCDKKGKAVKKEIESSVDDVILVKLGDENRPATVEDIADMTERLSTALKTKAKELVLVSHHAIEVEIFPTSLRPQPEKPVRPQRKVVKS